MYEFTKVSEVASETSNSLMTIFNGVNLDTELSDSAGFFRTLSVSGRGVSSRRLLMSEQSLRHGSRERGYSLDVREIVVRFQIKDRTSEGLRERFNRLNGLLIGSKKELRFTDEEAYFIGTLSGGETPEETSNDIIGTLNFICSDPVKRKAQKVLPVTTTFSPFTITGQDKTPWISRTTFPAPASSYVLETNKGGRIELKYSFIAGDVLEIDYEKRKITLNGKNIQTAMQIVPTRWFMLVPGAVEMKASHATTVEYTERFY
ncbi:MULTISPECIES: distal tail protein Dit [Bhargavaea]|uniref:Distal tail protein Dit n=1 Tax=Bhargavaea changchunensis TaxID=2134037 RepID=A0ABW2NGN5_9BACL|nr:distal tail protein Dit [Bhargavaea sp. CC-171006]